MAGFAKFFADRPILAAAISAVIVLCGGLALAGLPIAQYPEIAPPTVQVTAVYPGANAGVLADTVAAPIEQQVLGVEKMLYMSSSSANDGTYSLNVTFELGTNLDIAQVQVQNRVNLALPQLPAEVKQGAGVVVKKRSASILLVVNLFSPDGTKDQLYLSNYATINVRDELAKVPGVGDVSFFGQQEYSLRIWLDPERLAARGLAATDVLAAIREQNVQVAAGALGREPSPPGTPFQYTLSTAGRLETAEQFGKIVVGAGPEGQLVRLREVCSDLRTVEKSGAAKRFGGVQLGARVEDTRCALDGKPAIGMAIYQLPGSNALETAERIRAKVAELRERFPAGVQDAIVYDTTPFIGESIHEVVKALRDAILLVAVVVLLFLQTWRATLIPLIAVPVAIIGTFAAMSALGFSLNNLSLLGLVLAIGIVVDDAIVVVEAVEHNLEHDPEATPRAATLKALDQVAGPIASISLVLMVVFVPCAFIAGITGQFFRQFAVTVAVSTFFSALNSLTLSPALCALLLRRKEHQTDPLSRLVRAVLGWFFTLFNAGFDRATNAYGFVVGWLMRLGLLALAAYAGLLYATYWAFAAAPTGFVPPQDKGYLLVDVTLPDAAALDRTAAVAAELDLIARGDPARPDKYPGVPGVAHVIAVPGLSAVQGVNGSNYATIFVVLDDFHHRHARDRHAAAIQFKLTRAFAAQAPEAVALVFGAPAVDGLGNAGGFKLMVRDRAAQGLGPLEAAARELAVEANQRPGLVGVANLLRAQVPQMFVDVDREKCKSMGVAPADVNSALQVFLGGAYVNDINRFGRTWQVNVQADPAFRAAPEQVLQLKVRNADGNMLPLASVASLRPFSGPVAVTRYNGSAAATVVGGALPTMSSGDVVKAVEDAAATLPAGMDIEWTELTLLQLLAGNTALVVFALSVALVYLTLAGQYESLRLPLAVILIVPMCLLCAVGGILLARLDVNIFVQIGFVVLVGLASKNAILIVEVAKEREAEGAAAFDAALAACKLRLRPILMTSFAFILGVVPLALAEGAGAEMRRPLGIAVLAGMAGVTVFGVFLTPVFYFALRNPRGLFGAAPAKRP